MDFDEFNVGTVDGRPDTIVNRRGFEPLGETQCTLSKH